MGGTRGGGASVEAVPGSADDFVRNFLIRARMFHALDAFNTEFYELKARRALPGEDIMRVPDAYSANARLEAVLAALRQQNIVQGVKRSATAGGGSNTASDTLAAGAARDAANALGNMAGPAQGVASTMTARAFDYMQGLEERALAEALQNPQRMIALLERQVAAGQPLTPAQNQLLALLRGVPAVASSQ